MSTSLYQIANSNYVGSGSIGFGTVVSKFGRVAGRSGFQIEPDNDTANAYLTSRYASMSLFNPVLVLIPSATSGSVLYSLYNRSESGDFIVRNNGSGSRVNNLFVVATGSAARANTARFNYNRPQAPFSSSVPGLLIEPSAANGILNSTDTTTSWTLGVNLTSSSIDVIGVTGNNLTVALSGGSIGVSEGRLQRSNNSVALANGSTYTISFLMKKTGTHTLGGYYALIGGLDLGGGFNVSGAFSSGVIYDSAGVTNRIRRVEQWGTDVYRCSETFTMAANATLTAFNLGPISNVTLANNPAVGLGIGFAAPQIELGSVPTSFIPTTTAAVTRTGDTNTNTTFTVPSSSTGGTIYSEFISSRTQSYYVQNVELPIVTGSNRIAVTYTSNSIATYRNGAFIASQSGTYNIDGNIMNLGHTSGSYQLNDNLLSYAVYNYALTPTQAITLTT